METLITAVFCILVLLLVPALASMEYYAWKAKVTASPSVPWMRRAVIETLRQELAAHPVAAPLILELGSGWGTLAFDALRAAPDARITGYEISPVPLFFSHLRAFLPGRRNVKFRAADFFKEDFRDADAVLTYLTVPLMARLKDKFEAELKPGSIVICNTFPVPGWTPDSEQTIQNFVYQLKIFTYRMPAKQT